MDAEQRQEIATGLVALVLSPQMRDATLEAIAALVDDGYGTLVLSVPRSKNKPIDGALVKGGLSARFTETRDVL